MKLLKQNGDHCLVYSLAMVLDEEPEVLMGEIGHDGQEIWWPDNKNPKRGVHIQECIDCCLRRGYGLVPIELFPCSAPVDAPQDYRYIYDTIEATSRFMNNIADERGIIIGINNQGNGHAVAWDGEMIHDPIGKIYPLEDFNIRECWMVIKSI